jgi:hypothetical protein
MNGRRFFAGLIIGAILGGFCAALWFKSLNIKPAASDGYDFVNLSHGDFYALRINRRTGDSWGLTHDGEWLKLKVTISPGILDPDEWLKQRIREPWRTN